MGKRSIVSEDRERSSYIANCRGLLDVCPTLRTVDSQEPEWFENDFPVLREPHTRSMESQ